MNIELLNGAQVDITRVDPEGNRIPTTEAEIAAAHQAAGLSKAYAKNRELAAAYQQLRADGKTEAEALEATAAMREEVARLAQSPDPVKPEEVAK